MDYYLIITLMNGLISRRIVILATLCKSADREVRFRNCVKDSCILKLQAMIKLYMKVRIRHAIKMSNAQIGEDKTVKRNRKMLKLSHL